MGVAVQNLIKWKENESTTVLNVHIAFYWKLYRSHKVWWSFKIFKNYYEILSTDSKTLKNVRENALKISYFRIGPFSILFLLKLLRVGTIIFGYNVTLG